jgi:hypothetical protein
MAPHHWSRHPQDAARRVNRINPDAQARLSFAVECVNGLHYLADLDEHLVPRDAATDVLRHGWQVVDMAHVRWATASGITALDLCAAALGRLHCGITGDNRDLSVESAKDEHWETLTTAPGEPSRWIAAVRGDHRYKGLLCLRHQLVHRVLSRSYSPHVADAIHVSDRAGPWSPEDARAHAEAQAEAEARAVAASVTHRTGFVVGDRELSVPQVVRLARDLATRHVEAFLALDLSPTRVPRLSEAADTDSSPAPRDGTRQ